MNVRSKDGRKLTNPEIEVVVASVKQLQFSRRRMQDFISSPVGFDGTNRFTIDNEHGPSVGRRRMPSAYCSLSGPTVEQMRCGA